MIEVTELSKRYGPLTVLNGISLSITPGEVAVIVGPSGGGKSTFLRCLNGLESFDAGTVCIGGLKLGANMKPRQRNQQLREVRRRVGMVFQQFNLFPHRTVLQNVIEAPRHVLGQSQDESVSHAKQLLHRVGLATKEDAYPDALSGGQQQRVAIARALAMRPEAILFDEPTSALDPQMAAEVESVIADLAKDGQTMVVVTHSMRLARRTATTVYVFEQGRVLEYGPPDQLFTTPREPATRRFLSEAGL